VYQIVRLEKFSDTTFAWDVFAPDVANAAKAGQFLMIRLEEGGERIPLTVADYDRKRGTVTMVTQAVGKTTHKMLQYKQGDWFLDFVGPLGVEAHIEKLDHVVLVGGGLGVAPVYPQLRAYKQAGCRVTGIIGFRNKELVFWEDRFAEFCDELIVCTDDGSYGRKGFVTAALEDVIAKEKPSRVVAIGPLPMMAACAEVTRPAEIPTIVSLNAIMVDGTGMCGSCRVSIDGENKFACVDGPDFDGHLVDFKELGNRQKRFNPHEGIANKDYEITCAFEQKLIVEGKRNYKKLKELPKHAQEMPERDAKERSRNFEEVNLGYTMADALLEAERCIQCIKPTCIAGCPVAIDIPAFIRHLLVRDLPKALETIRKDNLFPSICGRVCPQESQCEIQCILVKKMEPVAIGRLERFVGDHAPVVEEQPVAREAGAKKVAIVGSGPSGLACAGDLARAGFEVVVYEALHVVGGVLQYGIPSFRLPREVIKREVQSLEQLGVRFEVNKVIGQTFTIDQLLDDMDYSAVFVGVGAGYPMFLGLDGEQAGKVYSANEFLTRINLMGGDRFPFEDTPVAIGNKIVVLGAGNTAMDCLRVSRRLGAEHVHCVYRRTEAEAPARVEEVRHAKEEGVQFHFLRSPAQIYTDDDGNVTGLRADCMELGEPDASGRRRPVKIEGESQMIECDTIIYALGTRANPIIGRTTPDMELNKWGNIVADEVTQATNKKGVFAGGDIVTGGATVILALGAGRAAARGIKAWIDTGEWPPKVEPTGTETQIENLCTRCHQPVEGDESYICCAGQTLSWRCTSCQKVSEGFAFPYGMCPACGGRLVAGDAQQIVDTATQRAVRHAFEIELGGRSLYQRGKDKTDDPQLKELFGRLVDMEQEHIMELSKRYHVEAPDADYGDIGLGAIAVYGGVSEDVSTPEELLQLAVNLEERARDFFGARARELKVGTPEWQLYRELEAEEYDHVAIVDTELARYREGKTGAL